MKYTVRAAAIATGVSESSLRTWERRYGVPLPGRSATGRRLYSEEDLEVIRRMASFVQAGVPASEAAAAAKAGEKAADVVEPEPKAHPLAHTISEAAKAFDEAAISDTIEKAVAELDWAGAIDQVLMPALVLIGDSWRQNETDVAAEHFASELVRQDLSAALAALPPAPGDAPAVLLACPEDERHDLGILAANLLLRDRGLRTVYLGSDVPAASLLTTIRTTGVEAVCLAAATDSGLAMLTKGVREIAEARLAVKVFVGGRAMHGANDPGVLGIKLPESIGATARRIQEVLTG